MIILFGSHYGSDTSELESGYLLWIIEKFDAADYTLVQACKDELSSRLKIEWVKPVIENEDTLRKQIKTLKQQNDHLFKVIALSTMCKGNELILEQYLKDPGYADEIISLMRL